MGIPLSPRPARVIDLESMRQRQLARRRLVRLAPELDGLEMVYRLDAHPDTLYGMPILAWGMRENGDIVGLVPWMESLTPCEQLDDPDHGHFVGYRDPETEELFDQPPEHKEMELAHAAAYFEYEDTRETTLIQSLPDHQGTHALCMDEEGAPWQLKQVFGWRLYSDGTIESLLADENLIETVPVLPGDACLYPGHSRHRVVYFFQRQIANRIRQEDPATLEALAMMVMPDDDEEASE
ncbi:hypothetical protein C6W88_16005 [Halomonas litopenaei]|uniref:Uncharacterized protein n=2 Tax=Halomonas TaxID=2745 RepID=A0AAU7KQL1_9GAMM|nr:MULTISPECIES: hypothetical protein [Halomonas]MBR9771984.1 hypothetical protein [Gammaproteobacteria bacterium]MBS8269215.1 hypothetical protein [Halomonas litopenaei]PTL90041.1 hypothetical protein C6W89_15645 [Halomonas sp. SYSU XM8]PTL92502.1 hypothetical protein C6W88_16005 [Halomonas litopenaei]|tara:strand:+ start:581 stop:1294 length:714 start_codon:yes stop_codon:yes gene_type:complete